MLSRSFWACDRTVASHAACSLLGTYRSLEPEPEPELWLGWAALPFPMRGASPWRRRAKWDERRGRLQHNRKTQTTPITPAQTSTHPRFPRHIEPGADSSPFCTLLTGPRRKCCRPTCFNIPSSLACQHQHQVRQHDSVPELPPASLHPRRPSQAHAPQEDNDCWPLPPCLCAPPSLRSLWTTPSPEHATPQPDPHSPPWTHKTTSSTQSLSSSTS